MGCFTCCQHAQTIVQSGSAVIGDPTDCIRQLKRYDDMGIDEVILGIDGMPHEKVMQSLELLGKYVLPTFKGVRSTHTVGV